ncbi:MAG: aldolase [Thaumarchaeota archaeon]|nr:aldolase [Nitrososphaerota archaeon]
MRGTRFAALEFLPQELYARAADSRVGDPGLPIRLASKRVRRRALTKDGKLTLLAADHPGRMVTRIREDQLRMADRHEFLSRVLRVMACSTFDGLLATADVFDEMNLIQHFSKGRRFMDGKLVIGSVNRGGVAGSAFELDDRVTGYDVDGIVEMRLDGAKFLLRFDPESRDSAAALGYCVQLVRECVARRIPIFVEPLPVKNSGGKVELERDAGKLQKLVGVVSGLGNSSSGVWLKLPYCEGFDKVAGSTTLPILLLGGEAGDDVTGLLREIEYAMKAGPNVRGVLLGRNLLYPPGDDPLPLARAIEAIVHGGLGAKKAEAVMGRWVGKDADLFSAND